MNLFDLWDFGNPALSEERFTDAADEAETDEEEGLALTQLARSQGLQGKFEDARKTLDYAREKIGDLGTAAGAQYYLELGRVENSSGSPEKAMPHFARALELAQCLGADYAAGDAAHMLAIAAPSAEQPEYAKKALEIVIGLKEPGARKWIGPITNNLGWTLAELGRPGEALPYFEQSLEFRLEQGLPIPIRIARYSVGSTLRRLGRYEEAIPILETALETPGFEGYLREEIGECLYGLGKIEEAKPHFSSAYELLVAETDLQKTDPERLDKVKSKA